MKRYNAKGFVYGKLWGNGYGAYPSRVIMDTNSKGELLKQAAEALKNGNLDSGMGFESLKGAVLEIEEVETVYVGGKEYKRRQHQTEVIGNLSEEELEFLEDQLMY